MVWYCPTQVFSVLCHLWLYLPFIIASFPSVVGLPSNSLAFYLHFYAYIYINTIQRDSWDIKKTLSFWIWVTLMDFPAFSFWKFYNFIFLQLNKTTLWKYSIFIIHSSVNGYLGWFPFLAVVNRAALSQVAQYLFVTVWVHIIHTTQIPGRQLLPSMTG